MTAHAQHQVPGTPVRFVVTDVAAGDQRHLRVGEPVVERVGYLGVPPWPLYRGAQVHGTGVLWAPTGRDLVEGDAVVGSGPGAVAAVLTADCVPLVLGSANGFFAAVHVGWRGFMAGVVERSVDAMRSGGGRHLVAVLGPAIGPCCYSFAAADARQVVERAGGHGLAVTRSGEPAVDLPGAVCWVLDSIGVVVAGPAGACTACGGSYFSYRARGDVGRQATVVWCDEDGSASGASSHDSASGARRGSATGVSRAR